MSERFVSPAPPPTAREREITEILIEECLEVGQRGTKLLRFGPTEAQPGQPFDNSYRLGLEIGDVLELIDMAVREGLVPENAIEVGRQQKRNQLARYMQTEPSTTPGEGE